MPTSTLYRGTVTHRASIQQHFLCRLFLVHSFPCCSRSLDFDMMARSITFYIAYSNASNENVSHVDEKKKKNGVPAVEKISEWYKESVDRRTTATRETCLLTGRSSSHPPKAIFSILRIMFLPARHFSQTTRQKASHATLIGNEN